MKKVIVLIGLTAFSACSPDTYTSSKYFDCQSKKFRPINDKQELIYAILERAVVVVKDVQSYGSLKDKKHIYISKTYYSNFFGATKGDVIEYQFEENDVPSKINDVRFCLKSGEELIKIADNTDDFVVLALGCIDIKENVATIGVSTGWQSQTNSKKIYLDGGGYVLQYKKTAGKWVYEKTLKQWMS